MNPAEMPDRALLLDLHTRASAALNTVNRHSDALNALTRHVDIIDERQQSCPARLRSTWTQSQGRLTTTLATLALSVSVFVAVFELVKWLNG